MPATMLKAKPDTKPKPQRKSEADANANSREREQLIALLSALAKGNGFGVSPVDGVQFMRANCTIARSPVIYEPSILIIAQGRKLAYVGSKTYVYDAHNYLVLPVPMTFDCFTEATAAKPLLGVSIGVDPSVVGELLLEMEDEQTIAGVARGIYSTPMTGDLTRATIRLLESMRSPVESRILGRQAVREIIYRVLCGNQSAALRAIAIRHSHFGQISKVLRKLHADYTATIDVESLAREVGMSVSTFHANFKAVTSNSPLQYLKSIRLHKARLLMIQDGATASSAASQVGYESASQFSREFKRFFGSAPAEEAAKMRAVLQ
jgi:AraC-like DNA-binding protein